LSEIKQMVAVDGNGGCASWHVPYVAYTYKVAGIDFSGEHIGSGKFSRSAYAQAEADIAIYPVGSTTSIRYNPDNPEESVLEPRVPGRTTGSS
jgi:hypothetical protein